MTSTSPAVDGDIVVVPYPSGDLMALKVSDGTPVWSENLARTRATSQMASMSDAARPAIDGGTVFAVGHSGRMIATNSKTGERLWSINVPGIQTPWVAGDTVYVVDTAGRVMALARGDGKTRWTANLPDSKTWSGPVLAGGTLWLASNKGRLIGVDAATGTITSVVGTGDAGSDGDGGAATAARVMSPQGIVFDRGAWEGTAIQVKDSMIIVDNGGAVFQISGGLEKISRPDIEQRIREAIQYQASQTI